MAATDKIVTPWQDVVVPAGGSITIDDTDPRTELFATSICVLEEASFSTCTGFDENGEEIDFITDPRYLWNNSFPANTIKWPGKNRYVSDITLAGGKVEANKIK